MRPEESVEADGLDFEDHGAGAPAVEAEDTGEARRRCSGG